LIALIPFILLLFPTGRLPSPRWRYLAWIVLGAVSTALPLAFFSPHSGQGPVKSPFGVGGAVGETAYAVSTGAILLMFVATILSAFSLVVRYHRASGVERQQLKWFALAAVLIGGIIVVDLLNLDVLLEAVMNSITNSLGMRSTEIAKEPSRPWNPHFYAVFAQVHNTL